MEALTEPAADPPHLLSLGAVPPAWGSCSRMSQLQRMAPGPLNPSLRHLEGNFPCCHGVVPNSVLFPIRVIL